MAKLPHGLEKPFKYGEKGFSLIELLVVIAILGVLAAVAVPNVIGLITAGNAAAANAEQATIQTAADAYFGQHNGALPTLDAAGMDAYIRDGWASIKGEYEYDAAGRVIASGVGTWTDVAVDPVTRRLVKSP